jgi:hypothetical protein
MLFYLKLKTSPNHVKVFNLDMVNRAQIFKLLKAKLTLIILKT